MSWPDNRPLPVGSVELHCDQMDDTDEPTVSDLDFGTSPPYQQTISCSYPDPGDYKARIRLWNDASELIAIVDVSRSSIILIMTNGI